MPAGSAVVTDSQGTSALVWIEDGASRIARGQADAISSEGLHVRLAETPAFGQGDEVAVRLALERGAPTVATTARVAWLRGTAEQAECALRWSGPPEERTHLEAWLKQAA